MGIVNRTWKDFIKHSLDVFSPKKKEGKAIAATALGYLDGLKDWLKDLSSPKQSVSGQKSMDSPSSLPNVMSPGFDPYGLLVMSGRRVSLPTDNDAVSVCLRPNPPIVCKPQLEQPRP